jgi:hypothetical protein
MFKLKTHSGFHDSFLKYNKLGSEQVFQAYEVFSRKMFFVIVMVRFAIYMNYFNIV